VHPACRPSQISSISSGQAQSQPAGCSNGFWDTAIEVTNSNSEALKASTPVLQERHDITKDAAIMDQTRLQELMADYITQVSVLVLSMLGSTGILPCACMLASHNCLTSVLHVASTRFPFH
jgi:hypothetical protein